MTHRTVHITTTGRRSGASHRIETWLWLWGDRGFLTGPPGRRSWYANLVASPGMLLDGEPATARVIRDPAERLEILTALGHPEWAPAAPLVEVLPG